MLRSRAKQSYRYIMQRASQGDERGREVCFSLSLSLNYHYYPRVLVVISVTVKLYIWPVAPSLGAVTAAREIKRERERERERERDFIRANIYVIRIVL